VDTTGLTYVINQLGVALAGFEAQVTALRAENQELRERLASSEKGNQGSADGAGSR
jgi:hypothetical protein